VSINELIPRYTTQDIRCRHRRHECDGGISPGNPALNLDAVMPSQITSTLKKLNVGAGMPDARHLMIASSPSMPSTSPGPSTISGGTEHNKIFKLGRSMTIKLSQKRTDFNNVRHTEPEENVTNVTLLYTAKFNVIFTRYGGYILQLRWTIL